MQRRDWTLARSLLQDDFCAEWPHSGECIKGADNFIAVQEHYPGNWSITIRSVLAEGARVVSQISVASEGAVFECASVFEVRAGKIWRGMEYWVERDSEKPAAWRAAWTEPLESSRQPKEP
ncbi:MAG: hypothetical protein NVSMB31_18920 [Vulcanimicrobiaceae bacterium]